jgi:UDPglucose--hexose-1-phosphate uridylyltransferase
MYDSSSGIEMRHDPVQRRWVIIASERGKRPMDFSLNGFEEKPSGSCPFCRGKEEMTPPRIAAYDGGGNPSGNEQWRVRVVPNKFPALKVEGEANRAAVGQYDKMAGIGAHEVIVETPDHGEQLADQSPENLALVLKVYRDRLLDLQKDSRLRYILIFKNKGAAAGASLSHSHSQLMATPVTPRTVAMELSSAREHYQLKERCIFCDILEQETADGARIVLLDQFFATLCPYASRFPFEMHLYPRAHAHDYARSDDDLLLKLAHHLKEVLRRMNKALGNPPYNFLLHTAPSTANQPQRRDYWSTLDVDWHWHLEILPRLTNLAGFEWGTGLFVNPTPPESAAQFLRQVDF